MFEIRKTAKAVFAVLMFAGLQILVSTPVQADGDDTVRLSVEGLSASLGEDEPRVLYILPWQAPSLPRRPRADLNNEAPELVRPADPVALERHRLFRENLNPLILSPLGGSAVTAQ
ncbi:MULTISPECIES: hypothetical protein [Marinobacter]|uniref:hypothetical protein n=1 Tax=Marinobacter TaxID=2742 RepID=UPI001B1BD343|nr:hypothetical protein [Marinobacter sp.]MBO6813015.1 hypothetical protein [Marinobacter sp.]MBO6873109.1 hypothetical protein [Marinobacter sp.]